MAQKISNIDALVSRAKALAASLRQTAKRLEAETEANRAQNIRDVLVTQTDEALRICKKEQQAVVKPSPIDRDGPFLLADASRIYGIVKVTQCRPVSLPQFRRLEKQHKISDAKRKQLWPKSRRLFIHTVDVTQVFDQPRDWAGPAQPVPIEPFCEMTYKRALRAKELELLAQDEKAEKLISLAALLASQFAGVIAPQCEQGLRLLNASGDLELLLRSLPGLAEDLAKELSDLAQTLSIDLSHPTDTPKDDDKQKNPFVLAERLVAVLGDLHKKLPKASKTADLVQGSAKTLEAYLRLEPLFTEGVDLSTTKVTKAELLKEADAIYKAEKPFGLFDSVAAQAQTQAHTDCLKAQLPEGELPVLKLPNPQFNIRRLLSGQSSGFLSRLGRRNRVGLQQFLVNEIEPTHADAAYIYGVVTNSKPVSYPNLAAVPEKIREGIDRFSLEEFSTEAPLFYIPLELVAAYQRPLKLTEPPLGRRFGPLISLPKALAKAFKPAHDSPALLSDGLAPLHGTLNAVITAPPFCHCSSCDLYLPAPKPDSGKTCQDIKCPYCNQPMAPAGPSDQAYPQHPMGDYYCPECRLRQPHQPRTRGLCPLCGTKLRRYSEANVSQLKAAFDNNPQEQPWISFRGLTPQVLEQMEQSDVVDLFVLATELLSSSFFDSHAAPSGLSREDVENALQFIEADLNRRGIPKKALLEDLQKEPPIREASAQVPDPEQPDTQGPTRLDLTDSIEAVVTAKAGPSDTYAPVLPGSAGDFEPVGLQHILDHFHPEFLLRSPLIYLVGSAANNGETKNDIDLLIKGPLDPETGHILKFRLGRMLPESLSGRVQFHGPTSPTSALSGPFTAYCALYDLVVRRRDDFNVVIEMRDSGIDQTHYEFSDPDDQKALVRKADPFLQLPPKERPYDAVLHHHFRGKSVHADLRIVADGYLIGYTLADQIAGKVPNLKTLDEAKRLAASFDSRGSRWNKSFHAPNRLFVELKAPEPLPWLDIEAEAFEPGSVGATRFTKGYMIASARPRCSWGERTPYYHEYFMEKDKDLQGIFAFRLLVGQGSQDPESSDTPQGRPFWTGMITKSLLPSIVKPRAVQTGRIPPQGWSFLPPQLKAVVPKRFQYWHPTDEKERSQIRDALVEDGFFTEDNIKLVDGEFRRVVTKYYLYQPQDELNTQAALDPIKEPLDPFIAQKRDVQKAPPPPPSEAPPRASEDHTEQPEGFGIEDAPQKQAEISELDDIWAAYREAVNMTASQLRLWSATSCSSLASLDRSPIERNLHLLQTPKSKWGDKEIAWAKKTISFIARMSKVPQGPPAKEGCPSKRDISLLNWAFDPKKAPKKAAKAETVPQVDAAKAAAGTAPFTLSWQRWKGQKVIRAAPSRQVFHLFIQRDGKVEDFQLLADPTQVKEATAIFQAFDSKQASELMHYEGEIAPGERIGGAVLNETKNTPSKMVIITRGSLSFYQDDRTFKKFDIKAKPLSGTFILRKEPDAEDIWIWEASQPPGSPKKQDPDVAQATPDVAQKADDVAQATPDVAQREQEHDSIAYIDMPAPPTAVDDTVVRDVSQQESAPVEKKMEYKKEVTLADGTKLENVQVWDPKNIRPDDDKTNERAKLEPLALYQPMKTASREANAFRSGEVSRLLEQFATDGALDVGLSVEPKYNGFRVSIQKDDKGQLLMLSEEIFTRKTELRNMLNVLPHIKAELEKLPGPFILDGEFMAYNADGGPVPRRELAQYRGKGPIDDSAAAIEVFDALYLPGGNIMQEPYHSRRRKLYKFLGGRKLKHVNMAPFRVAHTEVQLKEALDWAKQVPGSEGAMLKSMEHTVSLRENDLMAKFKTVRTLTAVVWDRHEVKGSPGVYNFFYAFGPVSKEQAEDWAETVPIGGKLYVKAGRTFNSKLDAKPGDSIRIEVSEMLLDASDVHAKRLRGFTPVVIDVTKDLPLTVEQALHYLEEGEVKKDGDSVTTALAKRVSRSDFTVRITKQDDEERYVMGVVLEPDVTDSQGDVYDADTVRKASEFFMEYARTLGLMHSTALASDKVRILENYIAPCDFEINDQSVRKGTWLLAARVLDDRLWQSIKNGELTGWSIEGSALVQMLD